MDHTGVDIEVLSINPYWYRAECEAVAEVIRVQNEALVAFCASQPERDATYQQVVAWPSRWRRRCAMRHDGCGGAHRSMPGALAGTS